MYHDMNGFWKRVLEQGLAEDGTWDWTTLATIRPESQLVATVTAKSGGVWAAEGLVKALSEVDSSIQIRKQIQDGQKFKPGEIVLNLKGDARRLFAWERPFLNLAAYACGIASMTAKMVHAVSRACPKNPPRIVLTRKTLPGYRDLCVHSVRVGGGYPHRIGLDGGVLIKENHIAGAGGISKAIEGARKISPHGLKIEVEVTSITELKEALNAGAEGVLLDNFSPGEVRSALRLMNHPHPFVEVSGGINSENIKEYALEGVDVISIGALTHSVISSDLSWIVSGARKK